MELGGFDTLMWYSANPTEVFLMMVYHAVLNV